MTERHYIAIIAIFNRVLGNWNVTKNLLLAFSLRKAREPYLPQLPEDQAIIDRTYFRDGSTSRNQLSDAVDKNLIEMSSAIAQQG